MGDFDNGNENLQCLVLTAMIAKTALGFAPMRSFAQTQDPSWVRMNTVAERFKDGSCFRNFLLTSQNYGTGKCVRGPSQDNR